MTEYTHDPVTSILNERNGLPTIAVCTNGRKFLIHNIAWGRDLGVPYDHITTNISPSPVFEHSVDFFITSEVVSLLVPESGTVLYLAQELD